MTMLTIVGLESRTGRGKFAPHSLGARFLDSLVPSGSEWTSLGDTAEECHCTFRSGQEEDIALRLLRPVAEYNECGNALRPHLLDLVPGSFVVAHDETGLDLGEWNVIPQGEGSVNGNKGLRAIAGVLGSDDFTRIAIGTGRPSLSEGAHDFFGTELEEADRTKVLDAFDSAWEALRRRLAVPAQQHPDEIPSEVMRKAQIPGRRANLAVAPYAVRLHKEDAHDLNHAVNALVRVVGGTINRYAQSVGGDPRYQSVVDLLEQGVPQEMIPLIRTNRHHLQHVSFDFRGGRLIEINAAPLPPFGVSRIKELLGQPGPGSSLELSTLCAVVQRWAARSAREAGRPAKVLLLDRMGTAPVGETWHPLVVQYLQELGHDAVAGTADDHPDADIIWANMTWMTPDRWPSVITPKVLAGEASIFPSPRNFLFTSKWFLTLLCDDRARKALGIQEGRDTEVIQGALLYTTTLDEAFIRFALNNGLHLYGKPLLSSGGRGGAAISKPGDARKVERPAVVQEWTEPHTSAAGLPYEVRIVVYGDQAQTRIWQGSCWRDGSKLQAPLVTPVLFK